MNKIEIEGKLDRSWVVELMANGYNTYDIATNYELTEDTILECSDLLDKNILLQGLNFSEEFITKAIEIDPKNGNAYLNRGLIRIDMKNKVDGCSDLQMALYLGIKDAKKAIDQYCK